MTWCSCKTRGITLKDIVEVPQVHIVCVVIYIIYKCIINLAIFRMLHLFFHRIAAFLVSVYFLMLNSALALSCVYVCFAE